MCADDGKSARDADWEAARACCCGMGERGPGARCTNNEGARAGANSEEKNAMSLQTAQRRWQSKMANEAEGREGDG